MIKKQGRARLFFMTTALCLTLPVSLAHAQNAVLPEIEIDGSVLETLSARQQGQGAEADSYTLPQTLPLLRPPAEEVALPPVTLRPPMEASEAVIGRLIPIEDIPFDPPAPSRTTVPVIAEPITAEPVMPPADPIRTEAMIAAPVVPGIKPEAPAASPAPARITEITPGAVSRPAPPTPQAKPVILGAVLGEVQSAPQIKPSEETKAAPETLTAFPVKTTVRENIVPPEAAAMIAALEAEMEPMEAAAPPIDLPARDLPALPGATEKQPERHASESWRQENPKQLYSDVPLPARRPEKQVASPAFVEQARKTAQIETKPQQAPLSARRLSVDDLGIDGLRGDALATRVVDMNPDDVARALNRMAPSAGQHAPHRAAAPTRSTTPPQPRIVRNEGEWIRRSRQQPVQAQPVQAQPEQAQQTKTEAQPIPVALSSGGNITEKNLELAFNPGVVELTPAQTKQITQQVLPVLRGGNGGAQRLQIVAFSSAPDGKETQARRTALSRALAIRSYLVEQGLDAGMMDVRALGLNPDPNGVADKVDLIFR